jgi:hypothetical protein
MCGRYTLATAWQRSTAAGAALQCGADGIVCDVDLRQRRPPRRAGVPDARRLTRIAPRPPGHPRAHEDGRVRQHPPGGRFGWRPGVASFTFLRVKPCQTSTQRPNPGHSYAGPYLCRLWLDRPGTRRQGGTVVHMPRVRRARRRLRFVRENEAGPHAATQAVDERCVLHYCAGCGLCSRRTASGLALARAAGLTLAHNIRHLAAAGKPCMPRRACP